MSSVDLPAAAVPAPDRADALSCVKCGAVLPREAFPANPRLRRGVSSWCRECHTAATRAWRRKRKAAP